jgi:hypothetical protein
MVTQSTQLGRPSTFTQETGDEICQRIATGETLTSICNDLGIPRRTVHSWRYASEEFLAQYARAKDDGFDAIAEETLRIADTPIEGIVSKVDEKGETITREDMLGHRRLQIDTRRWLLSKWDPKRYGDRITTELTGANGGPVAVIAATIDVTQAAEQYRKLMQGDE